jgi:hypothetical protein
LISMLNLDIQYNVSRTDSFIPNVQQEVCTNDRISTVVGSNNCDQGEDFTN